MTLFSISIIIMLAPSSYATHDPDQIIGGADHGHHYLEYDSPPILNWATGEIRVTFDVDVDYVNMKYVRIHDNGYNTHVSLNGASQKSLSPRVMTITLTGQQLASVAALNPLGKLDFQECAIITDTYCNRTVHMAITEVNIKPKPKVYDACTDGAKTIQGVTANSVDSNTVKLSWTDIGCPGDYVLRHWETSDRHGTARQTIVPSGSNTFVFGGLSEGTDYTFVVLYNEPEKSISPRPWKASSPITITTPAILDTTPPSITITSSHRTAEPSTPITLTADAKDNIGVISIVWYDDGKSISTGPSTTINLGVGTHAITAMAWDGEGNSAMSRPLSIKISSGDKYDASCTDGTKIIQGVNALDIRQNSIRISWDYVNCPGDHVVRFWESSDRHGTIKQASVPVGKNTFTATGLSAGVEYEFRVLYDEPDDTITPNLWKASYPIQVTTLDNNTPPPKDTTPPPPPKTTPPPKNTPQPPSASQSAPIIQIPIPTPIELPQDTSPQLSCDSDIPDAIDMKITANILGYDTIHLSWLTTNCPGEYMISHHSIHGNSTVPADSRTCSLVTGLEPDTKYTFNVQYINTANMTHFEYHKDGIAATTSSMSEPSDVTNIQNSVDNTLIGSVKSSTNDTSAKLSWTSYYCPGQYSVRYWEAGNLAETMRIINIPSNQTSYTATDLSPDTQYEFRVWYYGFNHGNSTWIQGPDHYVDTAMEQQPQYDETCTSNQHKIGALNVDILEPDIVQISWPELNCPGDYMVRYWELAHRPTTFQQHIVPSDITTYTATGLTPDTQYVFHVTYDEPDSTITNDHWKSTPLHYLTTPPLPNEEGGGLN